MSNGIAPDPDDFFAETRMSIGDHIEELRTHLWRAVYGFGIALFASFFIGFYVVEWITAPVKAELRGFHERRKIRVLKERAKGNLAASNQPTPFRAMQFDKAQMAALVKGEPLPKARPLIVTPEEQQAIDDPPGWFERFFLGRRVVDTDSNPNLEDHKGEHRKIPVANEDTELITLWVRIRDPLYFTADQSMPTMDLLDLDNPSTLNVQEAFFVWFKVCLVCGVVLGSPWIFWQIWSFVAAGLYPQEKKLVHVYLPVSLFLFLAGVLICQIFVIPKAIEALLWFNEWLGFKPDLRLNEWLSFAIFMPLVFGLSFQTPMVMLFLNRLGIMDVEAFRGRRRMAWFAMAIFAAIITPSTDAFSMLFLWVPMSLLFELGIIMIRLSPKQPGLGEDAPEANELVEV